MEKSKAKGKQDIGDMNRGKGGGVEYHNTPTND